MGTTVTSARILEEDACYRALNLCVLTRSKKNTGIDVKRMRVSLGALSDVTVVLGMRQSIEFCHDCFRDHSWVYLSKMHKP